MVTDSQLNRLGNGFVDGFTAIPEMVWEHLKQVGTAPYYNLGYLLGLLLLVALVAWLEIENVVIIIVIAILVFILASW